MITIPHSYLEVLKRRDFFILSLMILFGQFATAFLLLSLIVQVYSQTGSTFGVTGVILAYTVPALLLMVFAGVAADLIDRKKLMIVSYSLISLVVLFIIILGLSVQAAIPLAFLYFAGNSFFAPSSSAATAQLVKKEQLLAANSIYVFIMSAGLIFGFFLASIVQYMFGRSLTLVGVLILLMIAIALGTSLPKLEPHRINHPTIKHKFDNFMSGFKDIGKSKIVWYFFLIFAFMQSLTIFGVTLAPGFFEDYIGISIKVSPMFIMPLTGLGVILGAVFAHKPRMNEGLFVALGLSIIGFFSQVKNIYLIKI